VDVSGLAMSGLVPLSLMADDFYVFDESRRNLVGRRTRRMIRLGDRVTVQVARVDSFKKQVDFCLAAEAATASRPSSGRADSRRPETKRPAGRNEQRREQRREPPRDQRREPQRDQQRGDSRPARPQATGGKPGNPGKPQLGRENKFLLKTSIRTFGNKNPRRR
jgi:ribonuclease R